MQIPLPETPQWLKRLHDWINEPVIQGYRLRRIDIGIALAFVFCVGYYWITAGLQGAILGGSMFVLMAMIALWML